MTAAWIGNPLNSLVVKKRSKIGAVKYYEVLVASKNYRGGNLTYSFDGTLVSGNAVTVPLKSKTVTAFVVGMVKKPVFKFKPITELLSERPLPAYCLELAKWLSQYYACSMGEALSLLAPTKTTAKKQEDSAVLTRVSEQKIDLSEPLTKDQASAISKIGGSKNTTTLLHGETASGKTRVYLELASQTLKAGRSVILLTPEISLTSQLERATNQLASPVRTFHSQLRPGQRRKLWLNILESREPMVIIGPRSALFLPLPNLGLIVVDEAHEPAYKQEQSPRYRTARVASQLGQLAKAKVVLGTATPSIDDYYLASDKKAIVTMTQPAIRAISTKGSGVQIVDLKDRSQFSRSPYLSRELLKAASEALNAKRQVMIYLNRRGSARLILCKVCGWQLLCPNCDLPLVYHGDQHLVRCHSCGHKSAPPAFCSNCHNPDVIYTTAGTKAIHDELARHFPKAKIARFDSDNIRGQRLNELYDQLHSGKIEIIVGTQLLAKGLDLPKLQLVGVVTADTSLALPDFTSEERSFQLLYQVIGRVGRGHGHGRAIIQTYHPDSPIIIAAATKDWQKFYRHCIAERQNFRFPPFAYLLKLSCKRASSAGAAKSAENIKKQILQLGLAVQVIGPSPSFWSRRGHYHYWQLTVKSKDRQHLVDIARQVSGDWRIDLDPVGLL